RSATRTVADLKPDRMDRATTLVNVEGAERGISRVLITLEPTPASSTRPAAKPSHRSTFMTRARERTLRPGPHPPPARCRAYPAARKAPGPWPPRARRRTAAHPAGGR